MYFKIFIKSYNAINANLQCPVPRSTSWEHTKQIYALSKILKSFFESRACIGIFDDGVENSLNKCVHEILAYLSKKEPFKQDRLKKATLRVSISLKLKQTKKN